jgi:hypothetical protein
MQSTEIEIQSVAVTLFVSTLVGYIVYLASLDYSYFKIIGIHNRP